MTIVSRQAGFWGFELSATYFALSRDAKKLDTNRSHAHEANLGWGKCGLFTCMILVLVYLYLYTCTFTYIQALPLHVHVLVQEQEQNQSFDEERLAPSSSLSSMTLPLS